MGKNVVHRVYREWCSGSMCMCWRPSDEIGDLGGMGWLHLILLCTPDYILVLVYMYVQIDIL